MGTVELTEKNFREVVEGAGIVIIDWWASWCAPCTAFAPIFEDAAGEHTDIVFGKVNTEAHAELAQAFDIQSIPTLMIFRERVLLFAQPGSMARPALEDLIRQVRNLDMAKVRQKIEEHERSLRN